MPNRLDLLPPGTQKVTHNPTKTLSGDPMSDVGDNPFGTMTNAIIFGGVNTLLGWIDDATGLDLLPFATALEGLLGGPINLLSGFFGFLTPGAGTAGGGVFGPLLGGISSGGGGLSTLTGLFSFLQPTSLIGAAAGVLAPLFGIGSSILGALIPNLDASKITSGIFSLIQLPATVLNSITGVAGSLINSLLGAFTIPGLDATKITTGTFPQAQVTALPATIDTINAATIANSSAIAALSAQNNGETNSGIYTVDQLEYTGAVSATDYETVYLAGSSSIGGYAVTGHQAEGGIGGSGGGASWEQMFRRINTADANTKTVYQELTIIPGTFVESLGAGSDPFVSGFLRLSADHSKYVKVEVSNNNVKFRYRNGGAEADLGGSGSLAYHGSGSSIVVRAGTLGGVRVFQVLIYGNVVHTVTDVGNVTDITETGWGWGGSGKGAFTGQVEPTSVAQVSISDNTPAPVYGTQFRTTRTGTGNVDIGNRGPGDYVITDSFFDTVDYASDDLSWDATNQILTVNATGIFNATLRYRSSSGFGTNAVEFTTDLFRDTGSGQVLWRKAESLTTSNTSHRGLCGAFQNLYLEAGQQIKPGLGIPAFIGSHNFNGESTGIECEFSVAKVA